MSKVEKKRKERFETFPTELTGVYLRIEPGIKIDILQKTIQKFYQLAKRFAAIKFLIDSLTNQQIPLREEIINIAKRHDGLCGIISEKDDFVLTIVPREKITWDRELLKKSMGIAYSAVVREELVVKISIPVGFVTKKGITISEKVITKAISEALMNLGISQEDLSKVMHQEVILTPDEEKLTEMINQGRIKLLKGARNSEITWQIRVDKFEKGF